MTDSSFLYFFFTGAVELEPELRNKERRRIYWWYKVLFDYGDYVKIKGNEEES